jgi:uncharacterized protein (TIGR03790 family)
MKKQLFLSNCHLHVFFLSVICALLLSGAASPALALRPEQVLVVVNTRMAGSLALAKYYMRQRSIPEKNLLEMALTLNDTISREDYDDYIIPKVRKKIEKLAPQPIGALVTFYGMPLRIAQTPLSEEEKREIASLNKKIEEYQKQLASAPVLQKDIDALGQRLNAVTNKGDGAAVDSELMLVRADGYKLPGWIANPYFLEFQNKKTSIDKSQVLLVSRLDGPDLATVRRMIDDSIATEKDGLQGVAYLDARYPPPQGQPGDAYGFYDAALYEAKKILEKKMPVVIDEKPELFPPNSCPNAVLYCGWYSLGHYIDSFTWKRGAIGYHLASVECGTLRLRDGDSNPWCPSILGHGAAATIGPVDEPYLAAFPPPHVFFALLTSGKVTLGEAYLASLPYLSWQMILVGDPLYRPFSQKGDK